MKLTDLKKTKKVKSVDICIGYDDHCSVYRVPESELSNLKTFKKSDAANDAIMAVGKRVPHKGDPCDKGEIFLDNTSEINDTKEFILQIDDYMKENVVEGAEEPLEYEAGPKAAKYKKLACSNCGMVVRTNQPVKDPEKVLCARCKNVLGVKESADADGTVCKKYDPKNGQCVPGCAAKKVVAHGKCPYAINNQHDCPCYVKK